MPKVFEFPSYLQRTPEELAEEAKVQDLRRASFTRAKLTDAERMVSRGALHEETARGNLQAASETKGPEARRQEKDSLKQLAHGLSMQGRYDEAIKHHPYKRMKKYYQSIIDAIEMDDGEKCQCPDSKIGDVSITPRFSRKEVFSQKHGRVVHIVECQKCGHQNAREPKSRLLKQSAVMAQNHRLVSGLQKGTVKDETVARQLVNDVQVLKVN